MTTQETLFFSTTEETQKEEQAWQNLVQMCTELISENRTILVGTALHPIIKDHRDRCLQLGLPVPKVDELINNYKIASSTITASK